MRRFSIPVWVAVLAMGPWDDLAATQTLWRGGSSSTVKRTAVCLPHFRRPRTRILRPWSGCQG